MLAMLVPDITNPFFAAIVQAAQRRADRDDHLVVLADTGLRAAAEVDAVRSLAPHVDAVIVCTPRSPAPPLLEAAAGRPVVLVNREADGVTSVVLDQRRIVALALEHLRGARARARSRWCGARTGPGRPASASGASAATTTCRWSGRPRPTFDGGRAVFDDVLATGATAAVAFNDVMALGLLRGGGRRRRARCPAQLSIVGSDDIAMAAMATPALTTVAAPLDELAHRGRRPRAAAGRAAARRTGVGRASPGRAVEHGGARMTSTAGRWERALGRERRCPTLGVPLPTAGRCPPVDWASARVGLPVGCLDARRVRVGAVVVLVARRAVGP